MADNRIAGLNAITEIQTALDFIPIVDVSDDQMAISGTTKKITINQILSAGGNVVVPLGTQAAPSVSFSGDSNTGIFSTQADQLAITVGGTTRGTFSSTGLSVTGAISSSGGITSGGAITASLGSISGIQLISTAPSNSAPLAVTSQVVVSNLNSDLLDGQHGSYYQDAGNITAGTLTVARGGTGAATFTAGQVLYGNGTSALASSSNLFWDSTNNRLGLGTNTPNFKLEVVGATDAAGISLSTAYGAAAEKYSAFRFTNSSFGGGHSEIRNVVNGASSLGSSLTFWTAAGATGNIAERLRIDSSGNVGIGVSTAILNRVQIQGAGQATSSVADSGDGSALFLADTGTAGNNGGLLLIGASVVNGVRPQVGIKSLLNDGASNGTGDMAFLTRTTTAATTLTEKMRLTRDGNVGIGVVPSYRLEALFGSGSGNIARFGQSGVSNGYWITTDGTNLTHRWANTGATAMTLDSAGQLGIGTASPQASLTVCTSGSAGLALVSSDANGGSFRSIGNLQFYTDNSAYSIDWWSANKAALKMRLTNDGNLGIGTATPVHPLQVRRAAGVGSLGVNIDNVGSLTTASQFFAIGDSATANTGHAFYTRNGTSTDYLRLLIDNAGNVGVGIAPSAWDSTFKAVSVGVNSAAAFLASEGNNTYIGSSGYYNAGWKHSTTGAGVGLYQVSTGTHTWYSATPGAAVGNGIAYSTRMVLNASGNLGLGTASPSYRLDVNGSINTNADLITTGGRVSLYRSDGASYIDWSSGQTLSFRTETSAGGAEANTKLSIDSAGNVGIGTASPVAKLDVRASNGVGAVFLRTTDPTAAVASAYIQAPVSTGFSSTVPIFGFWWQNCGIGNPASDAVSVITGSTERLRIDSAGNVGIGVTPIGQGGSGTIQMINSGAIISQGKALSFITNGYYDTAWKCYANGNFTQYHASDGIHYWYTGTGTTTALTPTQAMSLDTSSNLNVTGSVISGFAIRTSSATQPVISLNRTANAVNEKYVEWTMYDSTFRGRLVNDAYSAASDFIAVARSGITVSNVTFPGSAVTVSGKLNVSDGTATAPSITFASDTDTGIHRLGTNSIGISVGGVSSVRVASTGAFGYTSDAGGEVTQATSRTTGVTLNKPSGAITLVSAAGSTAWQSFTVTNSTVDATDVIRVCQKSGTDLYQIHVTNVSNGSFKVTFATTGGTTTEQPVFNFAVIKAAVPSV